MLVSELVPLSVKEKGESKGIRSRFVGSLSQGIKRKPKGKQS